MEKIEKNIIYCRRKVKSWYTGYTRGETFDKSIVFLKPIAVFMLSHNLYILKMSRSFIRGIQKKLYKIEKKVGIYYVRVN